MRTGLLLLLLAVGGLAAVLNVPCCSTTAIASAVNTAVNGDTLFLARGTFTGSSGVTLTDKYLTIRGNGTTIACGGTAFTITGAAAGATFDSLTMAPEAGTTTNSRIAFYVTNGVELKITNTFSNGWPQGVVAKLYPYLNKKATLQISNSTFSGSVCGAVAATFPNQTGVALIDNSSFVGNVYTGSLCSASAWSYNPVAGVSISYVPVGNVTRSVFSHNYNSLSGDCGLFFGGLYSLASSILVEDCSFFGNQGSGSGLGATFLHVDFALSRTRFSGNVDLRLASASSNSNSIWQSAYVVNGCANNWGKITDCTFDRNIGIGIFGRYVLILRSSATNHVGTAATGDLDVTDSTFINCSFAQWSYGKVGDDVSIGGAAISERPSDSYPVFLTNCLFVNCTAPMGGAISGQVIVTNSIFRANSAPYGGGAIIMPFPQYTSVSSISASTFTENTALEGNGGAIYSASRQSLHLQSTLLENNFASDYGGAIFMGIEGNFHADQTTFATNTATLAGGAVFLDFVSKDVIVSSVVFSGNRAPIGAGFYISAGLLVGNTAQFNLVTGTNNSATTLGGVIYTESAISIDDCTFVNNDALAGAAVYSEDTLTVFDGTVFERNTATNGGAIYCDQCLSTISNAKFTGNSAVDGAAFYCMAGSTLDFTQFDTTANGNRDDTNPTMAFSCLHCGCCALPTFPINISIVPDMILASGVELFYTCGIGYRPVDRALLRCENGKYVSSLGVDIDPCLPLPCPPYEGVLNGEWDVIANPVTGDVVTVSCIPAATLQGNDHVTCIGPNWVGETPVCKGADCPSLTFPPNGYLTKISGSLGEVTELICDTGFTTDTPEITCLGGSWSADPECTSTPCPSLRGLLPEFATISQVPTRATHGNTADVACISGYQLYPPGQVTCLYGNWTEFACLSIPCADLTDVDNGHVIGGSGSTGATASYTCNDGYYLSGQRSRSCTGPIWSGSEPTCIPAICNGTAGAYRNGSCAERMYHGETCIVVCDAGSYSTPAGSPFVRCVQDAADSVYGHYEPGVPSCTLCDTTSFAPANSTTCTPCVNAHSEPGASQQSDCVCDSQNYEKPRGSGICVPCLTGGICPGGHEQPYAQIGYHSAAGIFIPCTPAAACGLNDTCTTGYTGDLCADCARGYYRLNGICRECPPDMRWRIAVIVIFAVAAGVGLIFAIQSSPVGERVYGFTSATVGVSFCQVVAVFALLKIPWQGSTVSAFDYASSFNLNIEIAAPECIAPISFFSKFALTMLIPFGVLGIMIVAWIVICLLIYFRTDATLKTIKVTARAYLETTMAGYLFFLVMAYLFLAKTTLSIFSCQPQPDGTSRISTALSELCYDARWSKYSAIGAFGIVFYMIGIPATVNGLFLRAASKHGGFVARRALTANFFVKKYADHAWFWETVIILRKLMIVIITAFEVGNSYRQIVLCAGVILLSIVANLAFAPYRWVGHNRVENVSLSVLLIVLLCALFIADPRVTAVYFTNAVVVIAIGVALMAVLFCFFVELDYYFAVKTVGGRNIADRKTTLPMARPILAINLTVQNTSLTILQREGIAVINPVTLEQTAYVHIPASDASQFTGALAVDQGFVTWKEDLIQFWDQTGLQFEQEVETPISSVSTLAAVCLTGHTDGTVTVWSGDKDNEVYKNCHEGRVTAICASENFFLSAGTDGHLRKWTFKSHSQLHDWAVKGEVTCITESRNHYVYGTNDGHIVSLTENGHLSARFHLRAVVMVAIQEDVIVSCDNSAIIVSDLSSLKYLQTIVLDRRNYISAIRASGKILAYGDQGGNLVLHQYQHAWDVTNKITRKPPKWWCKPQPRMTVTKDDIHRQLAMVAKLRNLPDSVWSDFTVENARVLAVALDRERSPLS